MSNLTDAHRPPVRASALARRQQDERDGDRLTVSPIGLELAPVLLADATWYGTLAAARDLGRRGVPVIIGYDRATAPVRWSRYIRRSTRCPFTADVDTFVDWLHEFGELNPGCVLYPTSDDLAFLIAYHRDTLAEHYQLFIPSLASLMTVLDKSSLAEACRRAGIATPATWAPAGHDELGRLAELLPYPVLIKPRSQALASGSTKGVRVDHPRDLLRAWSKVHAEMEFDPRVLEVAPELGLPIIQALHAVSELIYTVDGFAGKDGEIVGALACTKRLQIPRGSGPGVCFEAAELDPETLSGLSRLCRETGFAGVFDVEFALSRDQRLLIDFNPRFYNHMAFEIERGLPLPWFAYLAATGQEERVRELARAGALTPPELSGVYVHRLPLQLMLVAQRLTGQMNGPECRDWRRWRRRHRDVGLHDPAFERHDPLPALLDVAQHMAHPRSLARKAARGR
jgi:D-aspartate ligase